MSDKAPSRSKVAKPAKVWQSTDLLDKSVSNGNFVANPWPTLNSLQFGALEIADEVDDEKKHLEIKPIEQAHSDTDPNETDQPTTEVTKAHVEVDDQVQPNEVESEDLAEVRNQAYDLGAIETEKRMSLKMENNLTALRKGDDILVSRIEQSLANLCSDTQTLFEPLKRLALHLAEQLVLAELTLDGKAVDRLVQRCLEELDARNPSEVVVELSARDLKNFKELQKRTGVDLEKNMRLQSNPALLPGSIRATAQNSQVEDLIENRLNALSRSLVLNDPRWKSASSFQKDKLNAERVPDILDVEDTPARMMDAAAPDTSKIDLDNKTITYSENDIAEEALIKNPEESPNETVDVEPIAPPMDQEPMTFENEAVSTTELKNHEHSEFDTAPTP